jgi:hypothetical protein
MLRESLGEGAYPALWAAVDAAAVPADVAAFVY